MMQLSEHAMVRLWKSMRFLQLFVFAIAAMLLQAIFYKSFWVSLLISCLYLNILYVTLSATHAADRVVAGLFFLWAAIFVMRHELVGSHPILLVSSEILSIFLLVVCVASVFRYVLFSKKITTDILFASIVNYILIALLFARLYEVVDYFRPGSFYYATQSPYAIESSVLNDKFTYFSIVTIATLGYGDIVPTRPLAQTLAAIEAIVGQFYVAMMVAWLVSMHIMHNQSQGDNE